MHKQDAITPMRKQRLVWSPELHELFVWAVEALGGVDEAVPRRILELMKVTDLTRANIASHLQKYRMQLKREDEERREASVGHTSLLCQPKVSRRQSQWKMDTTAAWQQQQQMMNQNQWHQEPQIMIYDEQQPLLPVPASLDTNMLVKIPSPLQSGKAMITMNTGPSLFSDHASATMLFPGENAPTEARVGDPYNPFLKASGFPILSDPEFGLEQLGSANDFSQVGLQHDWELHNTSLQPDATIPYQPPQSAIPNMGTIPDMQANIPCVDNPGPGTILNATSPFTSDENWILEVFLNDLLQEQQGGTGDI